MAGRNTFKFKSVIASGIVVGLIAGITTVVITGRPDGADKQNTAGQHVRVQNTGGQNASGQEPIAARNAESEPAQLIESPELIEPVEQPEPPVEQEDPKALYERGLCYQHGEGVPKDAKKAVELYTEAAEQGYAQAQAALGECYEKGVGVERDAAQAIVWYTKAAEQGDEAARERLRKLQAATIKGKVTAVHGDAASINIGSVKGVREGMLMVIHRKDQLVGYLRIEEVEADEAVGVIEEKQVDPKQGDSVFVKEE